MYTEIAMFIFCVLAENPELDSLLIIHLSSSLKYSFTETVMRNLPGLPIPLEATDVFLETTCTIFYLENPIILPMQWGSHSEGERNRYLSKKH